MTSKGKKPVAPSKELIYGVKVKKLSWITDERGKLMEMLRCDDPIFERFGQVYLSTCYPGVVKGWHCHQRQRDNMVIIKGMAKVVLYDGREDSPTKGLVNEFFIGEDNPMLISAPPMVAHGFKAYGPEPAYMINMVTEPYNHQQPDEIRIDPFSNDIPYDWSLKHG